ncbi:MAG: solute carrier family 23 protein [Solobacterium sp.]|nr:solute carrier family 23 protein [Solobacterium sp.]
MKKTKLWVKSDLNGFFGLFTNNLTNIITMASLLIFVVGLPLDIVYRKIIPATGLSIFIASGYYAYMAYKLANKTGREDVTALPAGPSVTHMFLIVFMVLGPIYWTTGDANLAVNAGIFWCFIESLIEIAGAFVGKKIRDAIPRVAMLGSLAGISITYIALNPSFNAFAVPYIGVVALVIILLGLIGKAKMPLNIPTGLVAILFGIIIGWLSGYMKVEPLLASFENLGVSFPIPSITRIINGATQAAPYLITALPLGIYNAFETMDNLESAAVAGDEYPTAEAMLTDGITSMIAALFGSPFPTACYIGHAGWKESGARIGYSILNAVCVLIITFMGLISILLNLIPVEAIYPILIFIGLTITTQAFTSSDIKYIPAAIICLIPHMADWSKNVVDNTLRAIGTNATEVGTSILSSNGVVYEGMSTLGAGSIIVGMILGSITVFIIDKDYKKATITCLIGFVLSFFGIIHSNSVGININPKMEIAYLISMIIFALYSFERKKEKI